MKQLASKGDFASYLIRSLLSEGRLRYVTVEKTEEGLKARLIEREGPTGLIVTTTKTSLHPENETRLLSISVDDSPAQTQRVMRSIAKGGEPIDMTLWHALQTWLEGGERRVEIPFAELLSDQISPVTTRLRRDFATILSLIQAHALLHQATRERDVSGRIVATLDDYKVVRELVHDLLSEGINATISSQMRAAIKLVESLSDPPDGDRGVSVTFLAGHLGRDKSVVSRLTRDAIDRGFLYNLEEGKGKPARLVVGDLPDNFQEGILPTVETLKAHLDE